MLNMKDIQYLFCKCVGKVLRNEKELLSKFFQRQGVKIGSNVHINCNILTNESSLIEIGDNVTISHDVQFITHDNSISRCLPKANLIGRIKIGNRCFIGARSTILYGVELCDDIIVAAGSVVTRSFKEPNIVIGGNPAKKIATYDSLREKYNDKAVNFKGLSEEEKEKIFNDENILVKR